MYMDIHTPTSPLEIDFWGGGVDCMVGNDESNVMYIHNYLLLYLIGTNQVVNPTA